jgi:alkanesulfonate monooxygenase SsuD/methylene tetrahydromethanopterin reductase-like flavin-dependent oxidoreductase (luciferase family)
MVLSVGRATPADRVGSHAAHAEAVGLDGVFVGDHLIATTPIVDATLVLAVASEATERISLGFGVMLPALRGAAWAAKQVASLQALSGGRVILGVGAGGDLHGADGWRAAGVDPARRGALTDRALAVMPGLIEGRAETVDGVEVSLRPGAPVPPIWVGGMSAAAERRAVRHGDAWFPSMLLADEVVAARHRLAALAAVDGRPAPAIALGGTVLLGDAATPAAVDEVVAGIAAYGVDGDRARAVPVMGTVARAAERLAEYADAGVAHLVLGVGGGDWKDQAELLAAASASIG